MRKPVLFTIMCLFLTASLAEAQLIGRGNPQPVRQPAQARSAQERIVTLPSQHPVNNPVSNAGTLIKTAPAPDALTHDRNHVLLIGVNNYLPAPPADASRPHILSTKFSTLQFCRKDMEGLRDALVKARFCTPEDIRILVSGTGGENEPTKANVEKAFREMVSKIQRGDRVLVAFSGHGLTLRLEGEHSPEDDFLCLADAEVSYDSTAGRVVSPKGLIRRADWEVALDHSDADVKLFFIDACRNAPDELRGIFKSDDNSMNTAGARSAVAPFGMGGIDSATGRGVAAGVKEPKLFRFSSGSVGEVSYEFSGIGHGVFTHFLIQGMLGAAPSLRPGQITLDDLSTYVRRETSKYVRENYRAEQVPVWAILPLNTQHEPTWRTEHIVFSYPYTPGAEPAIRTPVPTSTPTPPPAVESPAIEQRLTPTELNELIARFSSVNDFLRNTQGVPQHLRTEITNFNSRRPQSTWNQSQVDTWVAQGNALQGRISEWNDQQRLAREQQQEARQELQRQQSVVAERYTPEFHNFNQASAARLQEFDTNDSFRQQQQRERQQIMNRVHNFNSTRPQTQQQIATWNQTGQTLQRDIDAWMTRTNPVVIANSRAQLPLNRSESAAERRAAGYNTTGGSGNRSGAGR